MDRQSNSSEKTARSFQVEMQVRDYELDLEGIVNNAVYLNYLEHARHLFLQEMGLNFSELHKEGIDAVVTRIEVDYLASLKSGDRFTIHLTLERKGRLRLLFHQRITKSPGAVPVLQAVVTAACLYHGRPSMPAVVESALAAFGKDDANGPNQPP